MALQQRLCRVMARAKRMASSYHCGGMLLDAPPADASLHAVDVRAFLGAQRVADTVEQGDVVEYWKSAPYLFNFMDKYTLKQAFEDAPEKDKIVRLVRGFPGQFLRFEAPPALCSPGPASPPLRER